MRSVKRVIALVDETALHRRIARVCYLLRKRVDGVSSGSVGQERSQEQS